MDQHEYHESATYITGVKPHVQSQQKLKAYVNKLDDKVNYAKWKQNLILKYNYNPLKELIEKVGTEKEMYRKKIESEQQRCMNALDGKVLYEQLALFNDFSERLLNKINDYETDMNKTNVNNIILIAQVNDKKEELMRLNKEIRMLQMAKLQNAGIHNKQDIVRLVRSKTVATGLKANDKIYTKQRLTERKDWKRESLRSQSSKRSQFFQMSNQIFYTECLKQTMNSIKGMNSSQDVQNGIFLDVMGKKQQNKNGSYSLRSKICDTLMSKYSSKNRTKESKLLSQKNDFEMSWETFSQLNWKQIMGIIMVKDRQCQKVKHLLEFF